MKKSIFIFFLALFFCIESKAQVALGISQYTYTISHDTVTQGTLDSTFIWVVNRSATIFNDTIFIHTAVQDSSLLTYHQTSVVNKGYHIIPPLDSVAFTLYPIYTVSPPQYHYDINVIVIWPVALTASINDSLMYHEIILNATGIDEIDLTKYIKAYPNPSVDNFIIENQTKIAIEEVRIFDSSGKLINILKNQSMIRTETWQPGVYMVDILLKNKQRHTIRIIKEK